MKMFYLGFSIFFALDQTATSPAPSAAAGPPSRAGAPATPTNVVTPTNPYQRMELAGKVNGLLGLDIPWHLKATYQVLGPDGKSTDTGTYEGRTS